MGRKAWALDQTIPTRSLIENMSFLSVLYVSALFSSHKPLNFGFFSYTAVFLCGVYFTKFQFTSFKKNQNTFHMKRSDKDELFSCDGYVNKRSRSVFYTKNVSPMLLIYVRAGYI